MFITADGKEVMIDGWHPRHHPTQEICNMRLDFLKDYLDENKDSILPSNIVDYNAYCVEANSTGKV